jgi:hypothetical protein
MGLHALRYHCDDGLIDAVVQEFILQALCDLQPDRPLCIGNTIGKRDFVNDVSCEFGAQQDETDLRTVPVSNQDAIPLLNDRHDVMCRLAGRPVLVQDIHVLGVLDQRVAANCDDDERFSS